MNAAFTVVYSVILDCHAPGSRDNCSIPLPRQGPLGTFEGQQRQPLGGWPATFLCLLHGRMCVRSADSVRIRQEIHPPGQPVPSLWTIESRCAHKDCGKLHTVYTAREGDWSTIVRLILERGPIVPCGDHDLAWREDLMHGTETAYESLV